MFLPSAPLRFLSILGAVLVMTGCGSESPSRGTDSLPASPPVSRSPASSATHEGSPSTSATTRARRLGPCLFTAKAVNKALPGTWQLTSQDHLGCNFHSDRGVAFGVQQIEPPTPESDLSEGLAAARYSCDTKAKEVPAIGAFACVEKKADGDLIVGNVLTTDALWVVIIPDTAGVGYAPELGAMKELLSQLPPA